MSHRATARARRLLTTIAAAVTFATLAALLPGAATASPDESARAKAQRLHSELSALVEEAAAANEDYDAAQERLGQVVTEHVLAQRQLETAGNAAAGATAVEASTVRAIYRAGGAPALYATVLEGSDPGDVLARIEAVRTVVGSNHAETQQATAMLVDAADIEAKLARLAKEQTQLQAGVEAARDRVTEAVARHEELLAAADAEVVRLEREQAAAAAAAASANAAASLAEARAAAVPGGAGDVPAPDSAAVARAIAAARSALGKPYRWGATGPETFDCSGLTGWAYAKAGVGLPRTSRQQWYAGVHPGLGYLQPGDLLFWASDTSNPGTIHHVALYIGNDQMIAAPHTGAVVSVQGVYLNGYIGAVRPTAAAPVVTPAAPAA